MRLLITTQAVDLDDPVLAFFHGWIARLAAHFSEVHVICLKKGRHDLPKNVHLHSLGKEQGESKMKYTFLFLRYVWTLRKEYDTVFVHMNPEYLVLAGWLWRVMRIPTTLWYIHPKSSWKLFIARLWVNHIVSATRNSFPLKTSKLIPVGLGVDTDFFTPGPAFEHTPVRAMVAARLAPVKRVECVIGAFGQLIKKEVPITLDFYGTALARDGEYALAIEKLVPAAVPPGVWEWKGNVTQEGVRDAYRTHDVHINATDSGSFDKAVFEGMACGCITVVSNTALSEVIPAQLQFNEGDSVSLATVLETIVSMNSAERAALKAQMRTIAVEKYSLDVLIKSVTAILSA